MKVKNQCPKFKWDEPHSDFCLCRKKAGHGGKHKCRFCGRKFK